MIVLLVQPGAGLAGDAVLVAAVVHLEPDARQGAGLRIQKLDVAEMDRRFLLEEAPAPRVWFTASKS